ncbi:MAG: hypothetical protein ACNI28_03645 [Arcobacter sp.]|uniref:hypothetical protein n=1 Tax=Arcobacter sp. TaxID=1872629 RepID=UPI003AFFD318
MLSLFIVVVFFISILIGVVIGHYKIFPFYYLYKYKNFIAVKLKKRVKNEKIGTFNESPLDIFFTESLPTTQLRYNAITDENSLENILDKMSIPSQYFFNAYKNIELVSFDQNGEICKLVYKVNDLTQEAFFYSNGKKSNDVILTIPGSGENHSYDIVTNNIRTYHNTFGTPSALLEESTHFVLIKPNEDYLSIHNNEYKLSYNALYKTLLNKGSSYSVKYLIDAMALVKYCKTNEQKVILNGLSQGAEACLYVSLQAEPYMTIMSSGYSIFNSILDYGSFDQIIISNIRNVYSPEYIKSMIKQQSTKYILTYGKEEQCIYGYEAKNNLTQNYYKDLQNVYFYSHEYAHIMPVKELNKMIKEFYV